MQSDYAIYTYKIGNFHSRGYPLSTKTKYVNLRCGTAAEFSATNNKETCCFGNEISKHLHATFV